MKWYAFKEENGYYTMLLDHNTTATVAWITQVDYEQSGNQTTTPSDVGIEYDSTKVELNENGLPKGIWNTRSGINNRGPITLLNQLKIDTLNWVVVETLTDSDPYTAEWEAPSNDYYSGNQKYTINYNGYKARVLSAEEIYEILGKENNELSNIQQVSFDNNCSYYNQCSTGTNTDAWGYWIISPSASSYMSAWSVEYLGYMTNSFNVGHATQLGVRLVIKVSKDKLGINS